MKMIRLTKCKKKSDSVPKRKIKRRRADAKFNDLIGLNGFEKEIDEPIGSVTFYNRHNHAMIRYIINGFDFAVAPRYFVDANRLLHGTNVVGYYSDKKKVIRIVREFLIEFGDK